MFSNFIVFGETWLGMFIEAFIIALVYGKFTRPTLNKRNICFSNQAVIAPCRPSRLSSLRYVRERYHDDDFFYNEDHLHQTGRDVLDEQHFKCWYLELRFANLRKAQICNTRFHLLLLHWLPVINDDTETLHDEQYYHQTDTLPENLRKQVNLHLKINKAGYHFVNPKIYELDFVLNIQQPRPRAIEYSTPYLPLPISVVHRIDKTSPMFAMMQQHEAAMGNELSSSTTTSLKVKDNFEVIAIVDAIGLLPPFAWMSVSNAKHIRFICTYFCDHFHNR